jgi:hypothetical protein
MKVFVIALALSALVPQSDRLAQDVSLADYLKQEKFNVELYELAFCLPEIFTIIEDDSTHRSRFKKRLQRAFNSKLSTSQLYFHQLELRIMLENVDKLNDVDEKYQKSLAVIREFYSDSHANKAEFSSSIFRNFIEYPEQVDDACLILLLSNTKDIQWSALEQDKGAMIRFANWINYGFEEFRYYPSTLRSNKLIITNRIIADVCARNRESKNPLVIRSLRMIETVVGRYQK